MALVAYDNVATGTKASNAALPTLSVSINPVSTVNGLILIGVNWWSRYQNSLTPDICDLTGVTYNGNACTQYGEKLYSSAYDEVWYYIGSIAGAHNVVASWDDLDTPGAVFPLTAGMTVMSFINVNQSTPFKASSASGSGTTSPITKTITTLDTSGLLVDCVGAQKGTSTLTITKGASQTQRSNFTAGTLAATLVTGASTMVDPNPSANATMTWTESTNKAWGTWMLELASVAAVAGGPNLLPLLGVG